MDDHIIPILMFDIPGLILLIGGINGLIKNSIIKKNGIKTIATIIDRKLYAEKDLEYGDRTSTYPVVQFRDTNGNTIIQELDQGDGSYMVGQRLSIIYLKRNREYEIVTNSKLFLVRFPLRMLIIGLIILSVIGYFIAIN
ncbi:hypothetical protein SAMN03080594_103115 [Arenibacter palladensis]|uniref:DUF3592 domain-containing protein n=1 Tax=Arenibacter palladensis TaxID=237373 RepID=A0A1M5A7E3_9FLAO|nr:DUF3592 domain-containing protein [Arenibacter palladensis]SHF25926.1 hypothetical protein SAMN03080594_103115 [Arenibacter palladensis]